MWYLASHVKYFMTTKEGCVTSEQTISILGINNYFKVANGEPFNYGLLITVGC